MPASLHKAGKGAAGETNCPGRARTTPDLVSWVKPLKSGLLRKGVSPPHPHPVPALLPSLEMPAGLCGLPCRLGSTLPGQGREPAGCTAALPKGQVQPGEIWVRTICSISSILAEVSLFSPRKIYCGGKTTELCLY